MDVVIAGLGFPEGPRWHQGRLWFSDFHRQRVSTVDRAGALEVMLEVPQSPSGLGWMPDGALLVVSMLDRRLLRVEGGARRVVADLSALAGGPCNDMVVDAAGRAYVGNFGFDWFAREPRRPTGIARIDPDGTVTCVADELWFPNGTVISPDGRTLIVAESGAARLTAFDVAADGTLSGRRIFAALDGSVPDGICLDAEGAVWVADARNQRVVRVHEGGRIEREIRTGERDTFACMLGGDDRRTLYVCTNTAGALRDRDRRDGRIESVRVEVPGAGLP